MNGSVRYKFRIFVADHAVNSIHAVANLRAICNAYLPDRHDIEVVDVFTQPQRALAEKIMMTPTLIILEPGPARRIIGTLSETSIVLRTLGLAPVEP